jgi:hypothetical protein
VAVVRRLSEKLLPTFAGRGVAWSAQRIPTAVNLGILGRSPYFFIEVAIQLSVNTITILKRGELDEPAM